MPNKPQETPDDENPVITPSDKKEKKTSAREKSIDILDEKTHEFRLEKEPAPGANDQQGANDRQGGKDPKKETQDPKPGETPDEIKKTTRKKIRDTVE